MSSEIDLIAKQEAELLFPSFDETTAFEVGDALRRRSLERKLAMVIQLATWQRNLFFCALPGSVPTNEMFARRKHNTVRMFSRSSLRIELERGSDLKVFAPFFGLGPEDYAPIGGAFPITVENAGIVGSIAVSGMPSRDDHRLVVFVLCDMLGKRPADYLPPEGREGSA